ncbi:MAG: tetratricopeptide repeat protein [Candidatus Krumholzibacteriia bacterium]
MSQTPADLERLHERYRAAPRSRAFAPLADAFRRAGRVEEAIQLLQRGTSLHPDYVSAFVLLGRCYQELGRQEEAEVIFSRVVQLDADNLVAMRYRAERAAHRGALEQAAAILERILEIDPYDRTALRMLESAHREIDSARARAAQPARPAAPQQPAPEAIPPRTTPGPAVPAAGGDVAARGHDEPHRRADAAPDETGAGTEAEPEIPVIDLRRVQPHPSWEPPGPQPAAPGAPPTAPPDQEAAATADQPPAGTPPEPGGDWHVERDADRFVVSPVRRRGPIRSVEERVLGGETAGAEPAPQTGASGGEAEPDALTGETGVPAVASGDDEFSTLTLARIYETQGYLDRALAIYDDLHRRHPEHREVAERLAGLQRRLAGIEPAPPGGPTAASNRQRGRCHRRSRRGRRQRPSRPRRQPGRMRAGGCWTPGISRSRLRRRRAICVTWQAGCARRSVRAATRTSDVPRQPTRRRPERSPRNRRITGTPTSNAFCATCGR